MAMAAPLSLNQHFIIARINKLFFYIKLIHLSHLHSATVELGCKQK